MGAAQARLINSQARPCQGPGCPQWLASFSSAANWSLLGKAMPTQGKAREGKEENDSPHKDEETSWEDFAAVWLPIMTLLNHQ